MPKYLCTGQNIYQGGGENTYLRGGDTSICLWWFYAVGWLSPLGHHLHRFHRDDVIFVNSMRNRPIFARSNNQQYNKSVSGVCFQLWAMLWNSSLWDAICSNQNCWGSFIMPFGIYAFTMKPTDISQTHKGMIGNPTLGRYKFVVRWWKSVMQFECEAASKKLHE